MRQPLLLLLVGLICRPCEAYSFFSMLKVRQGTIAVNMIGLLCNRQYANVVRPENRALKLGIGLDFDHQGL
jgi:hypothetical protein